MTIAEVGDLFRRHALAGTWSPALAEQFLSDSDDPAALAAEFKRQSADPDVRAALAKMPKR